MKIYFVTVGHKIELEVIKKLKPPNILISYFHFNKREKIEKMLEFIEYRPNLLLDSGAFSSAIRGKDLSLIGYIKFIKSNIDLFESYIQLDVFEKEYITKSYYDIMKNEGLNPIPVFHYGFSDSLLEYFIEEGNKRIAFGGTVGIKNKRIISEWIRLYCWQYPNIHFHLLGSNSIKITDYCNLASVDASTWIMMAAMGFPKEIRNKQERMIFNMKKLMDYERMIKDD
jgi:hypothetical protein